MTQPIMPRLSRLYLLCSLLAAALPLPAQTLTTLQQSYEKAVADKATAPYLAAVAALNEKYSSALDRLTVSATQAGDLDAALALREEKSRLLPEGTLPEDAETLPSALKAARATYRQQITALQATRDAATQPLKDHFRTLLQSLLTQTTQAGRLDEALVIREKIAALSSGPSSPTAEAPTAKTAGSSISSKLITAKSTGKTDPEAARQIITWALAHESTVTTSLGIVGAEQKLNTTQPGKFSITEIVLRNSSNDFPWSALAGMGELLELVINQDTPLTAEQTRHFNNLGRLRFIKIGTVTEDGYQAMPVLPSLTDMELSTQEDPLPTFHLLQERTPFLQMFSPLRLPSAEIADAVFARLSGWPKFNNLHGGTWITATRAAHLAALPKFDKMNLGTGCKVDEGCLITLKNLNVIKFNGPLPTPILHEVVTLPKLKQVALDLEGTALADLPDFSKCKTLTDISLDNVPEPAAEVVAKCTSLSGMKIFKFGYAEVEPATIAQLLSFKELEVLSLNECRFSPEAFSSLQDLKALKSFKELNIKNSGISADDLKALKKALPKCVIREK